MSSTIDFNEVKQFNDIAQFWWDEKGPFGPLHQMNPCRLNFIHNTLFPLSEKVGLDIGCGGGILTEGLARMGLTMTGLDASDKAIEIAKYHADQMVLPITYICDAIENHAHHNNMYDAVFALEIIEHVRNPDIFIKNCAQVLKSGGSLYLSTLNRTLKSYLFAIIGGEYITRKIPKGTHDWNKFISPGEMADLLRPHNLKITALQGMLYHPLKETWQLGNNLNINYILKATKL